MRISTTVLVLSLLLAALSGCTGAKFRSAQGGQTFPAHSGPVRTLTDFPAPGSFDRVGVVVVNGTDRTPDDRMRERVEAEAAEKGANAIIYQGPIKSVNYRDGAIQRRLAAFAIRLR